MCDKTNTSVRAFLLSLVVLAASPVASQTPAFEAASVRRTATQAAGGDWVFRPGGQFTASNEIVLEVIRAAYDIDTFRIVGGPDWIRSERYEIQARAGGDVTQDQTRLMLQRLLQERFRLRVSREPREIPIYALVFMRGDRRTGPRLQPASADGCVDRGPQPINVPRGALPSCGRLVWNPGRMSGRRVPLDLLAERLSTILGRVVVNQTGLTEMFDVDLEWTPDSGPSFGSPEAPSLFTALGEQLGLRLASSTGEVNVLVVDSIERPTEN